MPTGYTDQIKKDTTFAEFALICARGMGACVTMREDSLDTPIPEEFEPSTYHKEALAEAKKRMASLDATSDSAMEKSAQRHYEKELSHWEKTMREKKQMAQLYRGMLR